MVPPSRIIICLALGLSLLSAACASAPYTGRRQLLLTSEGNETAMGFQAFMAMKRQYPPCRDPQVEALVQQVGGRIAAAARRPDYRWEFAAFQNDREANAFCLPGGKLGVFTGILKYTQDETGLATVMAHEAGHALARHAGERLSQSMLTQVGGLGLGLGLGGANPYAGQAIAQGVGLGMQMGILLPFSRKQELEADRIGLILLAKAGYDPALALDFWKRMMDRQKRGPDVPQFMSTHPKDETRLAEMTAFLPEARRYYQPAIATSPPGSAVPYAPAPPAPGVPEPYPPGPAYPAPWSPGPEPSPEQPEDLELRPLAGGSRAAPAIPAPPCGQWLPPAK